MCADWTQNIWLSLCLVCGKKCDPCDNYNDHYNSSSILSCAFWSVQCWLCMFHFHFHTFTLSLSHFHFQVLYNSQLCIRPVLIVWVSKNCNLWQGGRVPIILLCNSIHLVFRDKSLLCSTGADFFDLLWGLTKKYHKRGITNNGFYLQFWMYVFCPELWWPLFWDFFRPEIKGWGVRCLICSHWNNKWSRWPKSLCTASQWQALSDTPTSKAHTTRKKWQQH